MARRRFTDKQRRAMYKKYEKGETLDEVAKRYDCHGTTVRDSILAIGGIIRDRWESSASVHPSLHLQIRREYEAGQSTYDLATKHGVSARVIGKCIRRAGGKPKRATPQQEKPRWATKRNVNRTWQWTEKEDALLREHLPLPGTRRSRLGGASKWLVTHLGRTKSSIDSRIYTLKHGRRLRQVEQCCDCGVGFEPSTITKCCPECCPDYRKVAASVASHRRIILDPNKKNHKNYEGMPFYGGWNHKKKGGSTEAAVVWILTNIGRPKKGESLNIMDHAKGFVPGNLEWATAKKQVNNQMFRIIAQQKHLIRQLTAQVVRLEAAAIAVEVRSLKEFRLQKAA